MWTTNRRWLERTEHRNLGHTKPRLKSPGSHDDTHTLKVSSQRLPTNPVTAFKRAMSHRGRGEYLERSENHRGCIVWCFESRVSC